MLNLCLSVHRTPAFSLRSASLTAALLLAGLSASVAYAAPDISSVHGCTVGSTGTTDCPTAGNIPITIQGSNFSAVGSHVYVGGSECPVTAADAQQVVCTLPPGSGKTVPVRVVDNAGLSSLDLPALSYAAPQITSVIGCTTAADGSSVTECARSGGNTLTINGTYFGPTGSSKQVIVGGETCDQGGGSDADDHIICTLPPGSGTQKPIVVLAANQLSAGSLYTMSYAQCPPGSTLESDGSCNSCPAGSYAPSTDNAECFTCPSGTGSETGSAECTGASQFQCWQVKDVSATKFVKTEGLSVSDEILSAGTLDLKKFSLYCTATGSAGTPPPDLHQCCYQAKGTKLDVPVALATDDQGVSRSIELSQPKLLCGQCNHL